MQRINSDIIEKTYIYMHVFVNWGIITRCEEEEKEKDGEKVNS